MGMTKLCRGNEILSRGNEIIMSWARDLMSWARDLMSWERDLIRYNLTKTCRIFATFTESLYKYIGILP